MSMTLGKSASTYFSTEAGTDGKRDRTTEGQGGRQDDKKAPAQNRTDASNCHMVAAASTTAAANAGLLQERLNVVEGFAKAAGRNDQPTLLLHALVDEVHAA